MTLNQLSYDLNELSYDIDRNSIRTGSIFKIQIGWKRLNTRKKLGDVKILLERMTFLHTAINFNHFLSIKRRKLDLLNSPQKMCKIILTTLMYCRIIDKCMKNGC